MRLRNWMDGLVRFPRTAAAVLVSTLVVAGAAVGQTPGKTPSQTSPATPVASPPAKSPDWKAVVAPLRRVRPAKSGAAPKAGAKKQTARRPGTRGRRGQSKGAQAARVAGPGNGLHCAKGFQYDAKHLRCVKPGQTAAVPKKRAAAKK